MQLIPARPRTSNKRKSTSFLVISILLITLVTTMLTACNTDQESTTSPLPFTISGEYYELSGFTTGYAPGGTYEFKLAVLNDTDEEWQSNCYTFLVDTNGPVLNIADIEFGLLHKGDKEDTFIKMTLPEDIEPGAYGFALLFPQQGASITTIYVGENIPGVPAGPWPDISSYESEYFSNNGNWQVPDIRKQ